MRVAVAQQNAGPGKIEVGMHMSGGFDLFGPSPVVGFTYVTSNFLQQAAISVAGQRKIEPVYGGTLAASVSKYVWIYMEFNKTQGDTRTATAITSSDTVLTPEPYGASKTRSRSYWN